MDDSLTKDWRSSPNYLPWSDWNLGRTRVTDKGLAALAAIHSLQSLKIDYVPLTDAGLAALKQLPNLKELGLDNTNITDASIATLAAFKTLKSLDLYHTRITKNGYQSLKTSLPECRIFFDEQSGVSPRRSGRT